MIIDSYIWKIINECKDKQKMVTEVTFDKEANYIIEKVCDD